MKKIIAVAVAAFALLFAGTPAHAVEGLPLECDTTSLSFEGVPEGQSVRLPGYCVTNPDNGTEGLAEGASHGSVAKAAVAKKQKQKKAKRHRRSR